jgi:hypothetical protein
MARYDLLPTRSTGVLADRNGGYHLSVGGVDDRHGIIALVQDDERGEGVGSAAAKTDVRVRSETWNTRDGAQ